MWWTKIRGKFSNDRFPTFHSIPALGNYSMKSRSIQNTKVRSRTNIRTREWVDFLPHCITVECRLNEFHGFVGKRRETPQWLNKRGKSSEWIGIHKSRTEGTHLRPAGESIVYIKRNRTGTHKWVHFSKSDQILKTHIKDRRIRDTRNLRNFQQFLGTLSEGSH